MSTRVGTQGFTRTLVASVLALLAVLVAGEASPAQGDGSQRIVGGDGTTIEEWPWQVAIAEPPSSGGDGYDRQFCGGSLISKTAVLTAAHCVFDDGFVAPGTLSVITGRTTLSSSAGAEIPVTDVIYFVRAGSKPAPQSVQRPPAGPQLYNDGNSEWDVAVLELAKPAPGPAAPVEIASPSERDLWEAGDPAFATGWGVTSSVNPIKPDDLREVEMEVISDSDCGDATSYGSDFVPALMVCAGVPTVGGKDSCQGDSGGPLVVGAGQGRFRLIGVTSFGTACGLPEKHGVYGRVADSAMRPAIIASISGANGKPAPAPNANGKPPKTTLTKKPAKRTKKRKAVFTWKATKPATFTCSLDGGKPKRCSSPFSKRVKPGRRHTFEVTATDRLGNVEKTPATYSWKVKGRKRG